MTTSIGWRLAGLTIDLSGLDEVSTTAARAALIGRLAPPAVVARRTAAWIWGFDLLPPGSGPARPEIDLLGVANVPPSHVVEESGIQVTSLTRTALDCARWLPRAEAVAGLDQFLRAGVERADLRRMAGELTGYRDSSRLREVLRLGDAGAASPGESRTRFAIIEAGFPRPRTQIPIPGPRGDPFYIDLGYERFRVGVEYDGEPHHLGARARARDEARRRWLAREAGWEIIPVTRDFLSRPAPYLEALLTTLLHRGWHPSDRTLDRITTHLTRLRRRRTT
ncbi:hypothetical protein Acsp03_25350 [Actinomadura sp. NBRC 104412]|uniref:hypothetical protein n=1 Tax=Actinomadura sp. NBRC 104412 TaxID=3032203 RepID=UPI0024A13903|nr:hypothetical protein [Actinomadura sp. NBRC 104412]GLZ05069.1 hypothetical protein Acsp03_25350 [Actinomadura sp. NBRC 104412]